MIFQDFLSQVMKSMQKRTYWADAVLEVLTYTYITEKKWLVKGTSEDEGICPPLRILKN